MTQGPSAHGHLGRGDRLFVLFHRILTFNTGNEATVLHILGKNRTPAAATEMEWLLF